MQANHFYSVIVFLLCFGLGLASGDTEVETSPLSRGNCQEGWVDGSFVGMGESILCVFMASGRHAGRDFS